MVNNKGIQAVVDIIRSMKLTDDEIMDLAFELLELVDTEIVEVKLKQYLRNYQDLRDEIDYVSFHGKLPPSE